MENFKVSYVFLSIVSSSWRLTWFSVLFNMLWCKASKLTGFEKKRLMVPTLKIINSKLPYLKFTSITLEMLYFHVISQGWFWVTFCYKLTYFTFKMTFFHMFHQNWSWFCLKLAKSTFKKLFVLYLNAGVDISRKRQIKPRGTKSLPSNISWTTISPFFLQKNIEMIVCFVCFCGRLLSKEIGCP